MASADSAWRRAWLATADPSFLRRSAVVAVGSIAVGIVTGGAVRLTGSGLGCIDWPTCTSTSIVAPLQYHAWVEFGNRLVNVVITIGIVLVALAALRRQPRRNDLTALAWGLVAGVFAEIVLGGETVLHKLRPPFVMAHFLLAIVLLVDAMVLWHRSRQPDAPRAGAPGAGAPGAGAPGDGAPGNGAPVDGGIGVLGGGTVARKVVVTPARCLVRKGHVRAARLMLLMTFVVVVLGTVVTSTGPHAGAPNVPRFGFSLHAVAQLHGSSVEVLLALTVLTLWSMHRARVDASVLRTGEVLLVVLVAQAGVGYTQYFTGDPVLLVAVHLAGATTVVIAMLVFNFNLYVRGPLPSGQTVAQERESAPELARI